MSLEEYEDLRSTGRFRVIDGMMEGKWFAETVEGVRLHARGLYPDGNCLIVAAEVPAEVFANAYGDSNLDRFGPARYFGTEELASILPLWEWESDDR